MGLMMVLLRILGWLFIGLALLAFSLDHQLWWGWLLLAASTLLLASRLSARARQAQRQSIPTSRDTDSIVLSSKRKQRSH